MNGADLIARILAREGVEILPAFPHSDLIDSAAKAGIRPVIVRQERQALHIADGYARVTGGRRIACTTVQYGPGSENAFGAVAQCHADNVPVLHIPFGYDRTRQPLDSHFQASQSMQHVSKWCAMVPDVERIPQMMQNAFAMLRNGRPGPVVLEVPKDVANSPANSGLEESYRPQKASRPVAADDEIREVLACLRKASSPVIVAGQGILYAGASEALTEFADSTGIPVVTTLNGKSAFPENHPLSLGCAGRTRRGEAAHFLRGSDLILGLGTSFTRSEYITPFPTKGRCFIQLTNWEGDVSKDYPVDIGIIGDARATLERMVEILGKHPGIRRDAVADEVASRRKAFMDLWEPRLQSDEVPINPYRIISDLMRTVDRETTIVTHDAGSPRDQMTAFYETLVPHGYIGWGKTTQLGLGLGLVQGARLARPHHHCINIMGDAAIGMVGMDLETSVRNRLATITIVLKNAVMGGYIDHHPVAARDYGIHELGGDYADVAAALGAHAERVSAPADFVPALERALALNDRPALIEVISSEEKNFADDPIEG